MQCDAVTTGAALLSMHLCGMDALMPVPPGQAMPTCSQSAMPQQDILARPLSTLRPCAGWPSAAAPCQGKWQPWRCGRLRPRAGEGVSYLLGQLLAGKLMRTRPLLSKGVCTAFSSIYTCMRQSSGAEVCQSRECSVVSCTVGAHGAHELSVPDHKSERAQVRPV